MAEFFWGLLGEDGSDAEEGRSLDGEPAACSYTIGFSDGLQERRLHVDDD